MHLKDLKQKSPAELVSMAEERIAKMDEIYDRSNLPEIPDLEKINDKLIQMRKEFYKVTSLN